MNHIKLNNIYMGGKKEKKTYRDAIRFIKGNYFPYRKQFI